MRLTIRHIYEYDFILFLLDEIKTKFINDLQPSKLLLIETYINSLSEYQTALRKNISAYEVCISGIYNLTIKDFNDEYIIEINNNVMLPNTIIKLIDLCKLINYGVIGLQAYPIFSDVFNYVKNNINKLYDKYIEVLLKI